MNHSIYQLLNCKLFESFIAEQLVFSSMQVMLVQACQSSIALTTSRCAIRVDHHITLTRPNTVLLMSTVTGGRARRGMFTGAIADQIKAADGHTDINTMFARACATMKAKSSNFQTPELRSTLFDPIVLSAAFANGGAVENLNFGGSFGVKGYETSLRALRERN